MSTHTKGPWHVGPDGHVHCESRACPTDHHDMCVIAQLHNYHEPLRVAADARLIASAPDLLDALKEMEQGYRERCNYCCGETKICQNVPVGGCRAPYARATIAKA